MQESSSENTNQSESQSSRLLQWLLAIAIQDCYILKIYYQEVRPYSKKKPQAAYLRFIYLSKCHLVHSCFLRVRANAVFTHFNILDCSTHFTATIKYGARFYY